MKVDIRIDDSAVRAKLGGLRGSARDLTPAMRRIAAVLGDVAEEAFKSESSPEGIPWASLKPATLKRRRGSANAARILQDTGQLVASIQTEYGSDVAVAGTNKVYAATHQFGRGEAGIPARPFLGLSAEGREEIIRIIQRHLETGG